MSTMKLLVMQSIPDELCPPPQRSSLAGNYQEVKGGTSDITSCNKTDYLPLINDKFD